MANFNGFPTELSKFFTELSIHNSKEWFDEHRQDYKEFVQEPSRLFVEVLGAKLMEIVPGINAIPKVNKSLFRINRDTRFSKDKTPYKTNLGIFFWEGSLKSRTRYPGFYLQYSPDFSFLGGGSYTEDKEYLKLFREKLNDAQNAKNLQEIISLLKKQGFDIGGKHYKRFPVGYEKNQFNEELMLYRGIWAMHSINDHEIFYKADLVDYCMEHFAKMTALHRWLTDTFTI